MLTVHAPVVAGIVGGERDRVGVDPLPEDDLLRHRVRLHLALHLDVEDLQRFSS